MSQARARQLSLFPGTEGIFQGRSIKSVTFKGKFDYPIHRWFRLTPSFSPELVGDILAHWQLPPGARVLDPFCGVGTTPLVCQEKGLPACAVELNPLLHFVSKVKTTPYGTLSILLAAGRKVVKSAGDIFGQMDSLSTDAFLIEYADSIPPIHKPIRWWSLRVLKKIVALKIALAKLPLDPPTRDLLNLAVVSILVEVSNARHDHPSLSFAKTPRGDAPVFGRFSEQIEMIAADLGQFAPVRPETSILVGNSKHLDQVLPPQSTFDAIITSPPYPNRYSYARETRPAMFYLELVHSGKEVGELETEAIGGTWGKATSVLNGHFEYRAPDVYKTLQGIPEQIGAHSQLMQNYVIKYFNNMVEHITSLDPFVRPSGKLAYVVGNSKFYGIVLPSDEILADLFEIYGFRIEAIERMRKRTSKSGLYEAIVFISKPD